jgi:phosphoglycerol transferase MdoB-like AlkP superfamily enzyme
MKISLHSLSIKFVLYTLTILIATKIVIFLSFGNSLDTTELLNALWIGFRFDLKLIATVLLVVYLLNLLSFKKIPLKFFDIFLLLIMIIISILSFINFGYYKFFGNEFNALFFGIINDGTYEVLLSILSNKFLLSLIILALMFIILEIYIWKKIYINITTDRLYINIIIILILGILARGSLGTFPLSKKTINNVDNTFLSNALLNPVWQLYYAYKDLKLNNITTPKKVLKRYKIKSYEELLKKAGFNDSNPLKVKTPKNTFLEQNKPNVIFVLMESWSSYIAIYNSKTNNVLGSFAQHAKDDYMFYKFFSNAYGTNPTIEELLLNSPVKDLSQSKGKNTKFSLFALRPFISQGYTSIFLSGGSSSWRNHNQFWTTQGFENYIGRATIENYFHTKCDNTWGVYDGLLFKYLQNNIFKNQKEPFFAFVLTTNNHPPVELPKDFKMPQINLKYYGISNSNIDKKIRLSAYHYQTNALGEFLTWLKNSKYKDNTIVVATGDHIIKGFKDYSMPTELFYKYGVPVYLYIPPKYDKLQKKNLDIVGSHNDIFPTLYHLALSNASYYNLGTPISEKTKNSFGWNQQHKYIFSSGCSDDKYIYSWDKNLTLKNIKTRLDNQQKAIISQQKYKNILVEYLINLEYQNYHQ